MSGRGNIGSSKPPSPYCRGGSKAFSAKEPRTAACNPSDRSTIADVRQYPVRAGHNRIGLFMP
ncbi:hypothetical protein [Brevundimonas sp.]|uniref:hypothetical protein n=1 Tax=Brevundimonas sp. TaxID=1871086 RepID=UPI002FCB8112